MKNKKKNLCRGNLIIETKDNNFNLVITAFFLKTENMTWTENITKKNMEKSKSPNFYIKNKNFWDIKINDSKIMDKLIKIILSIENSKKIVLYTNNLRTITTRFLLWNKKDKIRYSYSVINNTFYFLKLIVENKEIILKNADIILGEYSCGTKTEENEIYEDDKIEKRLKKLEIISKQIDKLLLILNECIKELLSNWHSRKFSIASISREIFLKKFNNYKINLILKKEIDTKLRKAYYGGRDEIFSNHFKDDVVLYFDFPSMHPNIMLENFYTSDLVNIKSPENLLSPGIYKIKAYSESNNEFPILPIRTNENKNWKNESIHYANGEIEGWYTHESIEYFKTNNEKNKVIEINEAFIYESNKNEPIFKKFIENFLKLKNETKTKEKKNIFKLILNSLSGRLGIKKNKIRSIFVDTKKYTTLLANNAKILSEEQFSNLNETDENKIYLITIEDDNETEDQKINSRVDLPIFINSRSNIKLHKNIDYLKKKGAKILAVKTDSIFIGVKEKQKSDFLNQKILDTEFTEYYKDKKIKEIIFLNPSTYSIKFEDLSEKTYFYNKEDERFKFSDFYEASKIDFNQKTIKIKNETYINSYKKRNWKNFNRLSYPKFHIKNSLN